MSHLDNERQTEARILPGSGLLCLANGLFGSDHKC